MKRGFLVDKRLVCKPEAPEKTEKTEKSVKINYNTGQFEDPTDSRRGFLVEKTDVMTKVTHDKNFNVKIQNGQFICSPTKDEED